MTIYCISTFPTFKKIWGGSPLAKGLLIILQWPVSAQQNFILHCNWRKAHDNTKIKLLVVRLLASKKDKNYTWLAEACNDLGDGRFLHAPKVKVPRGTRGNSEMAILHILGVNYSMGKFLCFFINNCHLY